MPINATNNEPRPGRHADHDRKNDECRIARILHDGSKADNRKRTHQRKGSRDAVANHDRNHRDQGGQEHERHQEGQRVIATAAMRQSKNKPHRAAQEERDDESESPVRAKIDRGQLQSLSGANQALPRLRIKDGDEKRTMKMLSLNT